MAFTWASLVSAIAEWIRSSSELAQDNVYWSGQEKPRPATAFIEMGPLRVQRIGRDWLDRKLNQLVLDDDDFDSVNVGADTVGVNNHQYITGDGPIRLTGDLPGGLEVDTDYWIIVVNGSTIQFAAKFSDSINGVAVSLSSSGSGTRTISTTDDTVRAGEEITHRARGTRQAFLPLQCFAGEDSAVVGATATEAILQRVVDKSILPSIRDGLVAVGIGLAEFTPIQSVGALKGVSDFEPRSLTEARFFLSSEVSEFGTIIESVELENQITGETIFVPEDPH